MLPATTTFLLRGAFVCMFVCVRKQVEKTGKNCASSTAQRTSTNRVGRGAVMRERERGAGEVQGEEREHARNRMRMRRKTWRRGGRRGEGKESG